MMFEKRKVNRSEASRARARVYQKERWARMKAQGLCPTCGKPTNNGRVRCDRCLERTRVDTATSGMEQIRTEKTKMIPQKTLDQIAIEAKAAGMSYGQYVARMEGRK